MVGTGRIDLKWKPDIGRRVELGVESGIDDAHNGVGNAAERDRFAGHLRVACKTVLPQSVAENDDVGAVGSIFIGGESAAMRERSAQQAEVVSRDANAMDLFGVCAAGQIEAGAAVFISGDVLECGRLAAQHVELGGRSAIVGACGRGLEE